MLINDDKKDEIEKILKEMNFQIKVLKNIEYVFVKKKESFLIKRKKMMKKIIQKKKENESRIKSAVNEKIKELKEKKIYLLKMKNPKEKNLD